MLELLQVVVEIFSETIDVSCHTTMALQSWEGALVLVPTACTEVPRVPQSES